MIEIIFAAWFTFMVIGAMIIATYLMVRFLMEIWDSIRNGDHWL